MRYLGLLFALTAFSTAQAQGGVWLDVGGVTDPSNADAPRFLAVYGGGEYASGFFVGRAEIGGGSYDQVVNVPGVPATPGYRFDSGVDRCREISTGRFAPDRLCGTRAYAYDAPASGYAINAEVGLQYPRSRRGTTVSVAAGLSIYEGSGSGETAYSLPLYGSLSARLPVLSVSDTGTIDLRVRGNAGTSGYSLLTIGMQASF